MDTIAGYRVERGYIHTQGHTGHMVPGIVIYAPGADRGTVFFAKTDLLSSEVPIGCITLGDVPRSSRPKRKDLLKQLKRANDTIDLCKQQRDEALALCDERAAEITQVKTEREDMIVLADARLSEISRLNRNLVDTATVAQTYKDERDALQRQVELLSTRIDPATEGLLRDHRNTLRQALSLLMRRVDPSTCAEHLAAARHALEQTK